MLGKDDLPVPAIPGDRIAVRGYGIQVTVLGSTVAGLLGLTVGFARAEIGRAGRGCCP